MNFDKSNIAYPIKNNYNFLTHCGVSPIPKIGYNTSVSLLEDQMNRGAITFLDNYDSVLEEFKLVTSQLINASTQDMALVKNTSEAFSMVANGYPFKNGDEIISFIDEYPANHYPWKAQEKRGVKLKLIPRKLFKSFNHKGYWEFEDLKKLITTKTKIIAISHVQFTSGYAANLEKIGNLCKEHNIDFIVDVAQSLGSIPIDVKKYNISALASSSWKWLLGPIGLGVFYTSADFRKKLDTVSVGVETMAQYRDYLNHDWNPLKSAKRFEYSTSPISLASGLSAIIKNIHLKYSLKSINKEILMLQDYFLKQLTNNDFTPLKFSEEHRSGILSLYHPKAEDVVEYLFKKNIICSIRGGLFRVAPHFYNTLKDMDELANCLNKFKKI